MSVMRSIEGSTVRRRPGLLEAPAFFLPLFTYSPNVGEEVFSEVHNTKQRQTYAIGV